MSKSNKDTLEVEEQNKYLAFSTQQLRIAWEKYMCMNLTPYEFGTNMDFIALCKQCDFRKITPWN